jgi:hypothetical protein
MAAKAKQQGVEGLAPGDEVYCRHPKVGATMLKVLAVGKDGFQGIGEDGQTHKVRHSEYLGHKVRALHTYKVKDEGVDGAILERKDGQRRYVPKPEETAAKAIGAKDLDPLLSDLDALVEKAIRPLPLGPEWIMKAIGRRALFDPAKQKRSQTRNNGQFSKKVGGAHATPKPGLKSLPEPSHRHGDRVRFRHGTIEGEGELIGSGQDGVTVRDDQGREHLVRHDALLPPTDEEKAARAEARKAKVKPAKGQKPKKAAENAVL